MTVRRISIVAIGILLSTAGAAQGALLNLQMRYPLVVSDFLCARYDADAAGTEGVMTATAWTSNYNLGSGGIPLMQLGTFVFTAQIVPGTGVATSGSLEVKGDIDNDSVDETLFKSDTILAFGFGVEDKFEAIFLQESGTMAPPGSIIGVIMDARNLNEFNGIPPSFCADFGPSTGLKVDTFVLVPVPEPVTALVSLPWLMALMALRRRLARRRKASKSGLAQ